MRFIHSNVQKYDKIIIGAGLYGIYAAWYSGLKGEKVLVLERDDDLFQRATYINQARVHMGYHYPRSYSTAIKSKNYFDRFVDEFPNSIYSEFNQIYATSKNFSWTNREQFINFCRNTGIQCDEISISTYFNNDVCDGAFMTKEYTYDANELKIDLLHKIQEMSNVNILCNHEVKTIEKDDNYYYISANDKEYRTEFLLNASYASINQILDMIGYEKFKIKYELCEIILCRINKNLKNVGITVMDGPFFSIMPFGKTGYHSLTSVTFTPHKVSMNDLPTFSCQNDNESYCNYKSLGNCNNCMNKPKTAWIYMSSLAKKYLRSNFEFEYVDSLYSMKPILKLSEIDDSRPTVIKKFSDKPMFYSVLSGKINTVYDLEEIL
ncbi:FAD-dependent oxidoreductase [Candidatus Stoquefichus massiliensis]|uniref:FAD-dependent oxidoreductase n=1 Tax=Candidatus Stoquefichus massiliensis TaxID=1470350 RepID=UPI0004B921B7|nr:FAD-dependent oxidoreductase [Candidatus Stoquefichus massiliensis]